LHRILSKFNNNLVPDTSQPAGSNLHIRFWPSQKKPKMRHLLFCIGAMLETLILTAGCRLSSRR